MELTQLAEEARRPFRRGHLLNFAGVPLALHRGPTAGSDAGQRCQSVLLTLGNRGELSGNGEVAEEVGDRSGALLPDDRLAPAFLSATTQDR